MLPQGKQKVVVTKNDQQESISTTAQPLSVAEPEMRERRGEQKVAREGEGLDAPFEDEIRNTQEETKRVEAEKMVLRILSHEVTWIKFQLDEDEPFDVLLKSGETFKVKASKKFNLRIGNAGGVELFLNGNALGSPGKRGEVVELTLPE